PTTGELLNDDSIVEIKRLSELQRNSYNVQIVISDGLNVFAITDAGHLLPYLNRLRELLSSSGYRVAPENIIVTNGRVRIGYRIGELIFEKQSHYATASIIHIIGERPGNGHHTFSVYITNMLGVH